MRRPAAPLLVAVAVAALGALAPPLCAPAVAGETEHVVIVLIDGPRASESFDPAGRANIPVLWGKLRPLGAHSLGFRNDGKTSTNPGHAAVLTGRWQRIANDGGEPPHRPTIFELYRQAKDAPRESCWLVASKGKLETLAASDAPGYGPALGAAVDAPAFVRTDEATADAVFRVLEKHRPAIVLVNLAGPDIHAHLGQRREYERAIRTADGLIGRMWNAIEANPDLRGKTALIVTADHGRHPDGHDDGFRSHGDACEGCRRIPFFAVGPEVEAGVTLEGGSQVDIAPTVGKWLGFEVPEAEGRPLDAILRKRAASPRAGPF